MNFMSTVDNGHKLTTAVVLPEQCQCNRSTMATTLVVLQYSVIPNKASLHLSLPAAAAAIV